MKMCWLLHTKGRDGLPSTPAKHQASLVNQAEICISSLTNFQTLAPGWRCSKG